MKQKQKYIKVNHTLHACMLVCMQNISGRLCDTLVMGAGLEGSGILRGSRGRGDLPTLSSLKGFKITEKFKE